MTTKKHIAFCISGQARTFDITYNYFKLNLFDQAKEQGFDYDVFCAAEDDEDIEKVYAINPTEIIRIKSSEVQKIIDEKYSKYLNTIFDKKVCFIDKDSKILERLLQQLYKIQKANELKNNHSKKYNIKYDIVVRLRFDNMFIRKINFNEIYDRIINHNEVIVNGTPNGKLALIPIADFFAFGSNKDMDIYSNLFDNVQSVFSKNNPNAFQKILLFILGMFKKIMFFIEERKIPIISKYTSLFKFGVYILVNYFFINVYVFEKIFYENLINNGIKLNKNAINNILIRNNKQSFVIMFQKSEFEI